MPRWCDAAVALLLLIALSPVLLVVAVLVAASSRGPVLFHQVRVGKDGALFSLLKFRTMGVAIGPASSLTVGQDPRITRVGRPLRKHRFDELPQLVNVLRGEMALVGPRPELPGYLTPALAAGLLRRRPGLTDPASLTFRDESSLLAEVADPDAYYRAVVLPAKAAISTDYALRRTLRSDVRVLIRTALCLLPGDGPPTPSPHT